MAEVTREGSRRAYKNTTVNVERDDFYVCVCIRHIIIQKKNKRKKKIKLKMVTTINMTMAHKGDTRGLL